MGIRTPRFSTCCNRFFVLLGALLLCLGAPAAQAAAARVDFTVGEVVAIQADGQTRRLQRGAEVSAGETIDTGQGGRAQLRFTDGAMVSLQPQTRFRIDAYAFKSQAADGSEKGFFSLLKGAMRTITGLVGKADHKAYRLSTTVATIGIRGTEYSVSYAADGQGVTETTHSGLVEVCNDAGCVLVEAGQSVQVPDVGTRPAFTARNALDPFLKPQGTTTPEFSSGNDSGQIGAGHPASPDPAGSPNYPGGGQTPPGNPLLAD